MQQPSPGSKDSNVAVSMPVYQESSHPMIGQCGDVSEVIGNNQGLSSGNVMDPQTQAQFEADKRAVYKHPLFPLLALLFEKCELATQSAEVPSSESFSVDIQAFVQHQERDRKPIFSDDPEVDGLMVKAIQVLRIHLLELEKVQELCKDFCNRYIACLKNKMQSENLLRSDLPIMCGSGMSSPSSSSSPPLPSRSVSPQPQQNSVSGNVSALSPGQIVSGGTLYQMVQTPQGIVAQPVQVQSSQIQPVITSIHGGTPLSQIGANSSSVNHDAHAQSLASRPLSPSGDEDDDILGKKKQKRGVLPKHATSIMRSWLFQHIVHPYPTEDEKRQIAAQTNLTLLQVNNWFINARRRILQPMLDASNPDTSHKSKKVKTQSVRPVQRFWPDNIASIQPQVLGQNHEGSDQEQSSLQAHSSGMNSDQCNNDAQVVSTSPSVAGPSSPSLSPSGSDVSDDGFDEVRSSREGDSK